jgi:hypothetical protein
LPRGLAERVGERRKGECGRSLAARQAFERLAAGGAGRARERAEDRRQLAGIGARRLQRKRAFDRRLVPLPGKT